MSLRGGSEFVFDVALVSFIGITAQDIGAACAARECVVDPDNVGTPVRIDRRETTICKLEMIIDQRGERQFLVAGQNHGDA
ncbi:MAG TPA: hypothetical protein VES91_00325, partial [Burkholderiaceae bacterium]|nr:hypothetical protein [Burkholderiaceae bacterium]